MWLTKLLNFNTIDEEDEKWIEEDALKYAAIVNSKKYADSNSDTTALENLMRAISFGEAPDEALERNPATEYHKSSDDDGENKKHTFQDHYNKHLKLLDELETNEVLPAQPVYQPAKFDRKSNFRLPYYDIPRWIMASMDRKDKFNFLPVSYDNYVETFQKLLWIEESHQVIEMRRYDMSDVMLCNHDHAFFSIEVPGLAEGRPSLMKGDKLILRSDKRSTSYEGYIHDVRELDILIRLHENLHSTTMDGLKFDVHFLCSRTMFRRSHHAICEYKSNPNMKSVVFPIVKDNQESFERDKVDLQDQSQLKLINASLNIFQRNAMINALKSVARPAPYIIFGPPGTGKTNTLVETIIQVYLRKPHDKILVCANSNSCADLCAIKILKSNIVNENHLVRISAFYRMEKLIPSELEDVTMDMDMLNPRMYHDFRIIVTTCIQSGALNSFAEKFDWIFIDEAGHASEPEALVAISLMAPDGCCVLAGDHKQLGPICISDSASSGGLGTSLLDRLSRRSVYTPQVRNGKMSYDERYLTKLIISYRCDERVMQVNNKLFYDNELKFTLKTPVKWLKLFKVDHPLIFHAVKGRERKEYVNPSWFNPNEAIRCLMYMKILYQAGLRADQLGVITPYRRQIEKIKILLKACDLKECKIGTMEEFQGDEREVVIISTVRTREKNLKLDQKFKLGFLFDQRRFNVAVSRAKWLVIVVGDPIILGRDPCWSEYIQVANNFKDD